jgi:hypothetical protein
MDTVFGDPGRVNPIDERFCIDLNDNLYTPGDTINFYFSARNANGNTNYWSQPTGMTDSEFQAQSDEMEMTCLPANGLEMGNDILYVNGFLEYHKELFFETAFEQLDIHPDRYDIRGESYYSPAASGPGGRVVDFIQQLITPYRIILWSSGNYDTPGDGVEDKADDFSLLYQFVDIHPEDCGLYIAGNDVAYRWANLTGAGAVSLKHFYIDHALIDGDHQMVGESINPLVIGQPGSCFYHSLHADTLVAYGGCPYWLKEFDVIAPAGTSTLEMAYSNNPANGAVISQTTTNSTGSDAKVILSGFSYPYIRDDRPSLVLDRVHHLRDILICLNVLPIEPTPVHPHQRLHNRLSQNYPNPFNPFTTIDYSIKEKGHVSIKIYNVAGQLVRTLVNEVKIPKTEGYSVVWDGRNDTNDPVSTGVYFCRLVAKNFANTKKMVLLK